VQLAASSCRRSRSIATNQRAMRSKRGHQNAQTPGRARAAPNASRPIAMSRSNASTGSR
jgi:hypothetical protein